MGWVRVYGGWRVVWWCAVLCCAVLCCRWAVLCCAVLCPVPCCEGYCPCLRNVYAVLLPGELGVGGVRGGSLLGGAGCIVGGGGWCGRLSGFA
jgi:hypothetical protein